MEYYCMNVFKLVQIQHLLYCPKLMKMLNIFLLLATIVCIPFVISFSDLLLGPGRWLVLNIMPCEDPDQYVEFNITRKKINRTHDCFDLSMDLDRVVNTSYAVEIKVYKKVDGGFKYFQTFADDNACSFIMEHAEENVKRALTLGNIDPTDCPLQPGPIRIRNFVMDYRELPKNGVYGTFEANVRFSYQKQEFTCVRIILNFDKRNDDENDEDDEDDVD